MAGLAETLDLEGQRALSRVLRGLGTGSFALKLGRYEIGDVLGTGACGQVYAARDPELDRDVAIKVLLASSSSRRRDPEAEARLRREAEALARLADPHVVPVYDVGIDEVTVGREGRTRCGVYVVMARLQGRTLDRWQRESSPSVEAIVAAYLEAAQGLQAAHAVDVIHRDFKPSNVMRTDDGTVVVLDFGLARALDDSQSAPSERNRSDASTRTDRSAQVSGSGSLTMTGTVVGTPRYMAPEQHAAETIGAAADQFAWCVALWEALDGQPPFEGDTIVSLAIAKREGKLRAGRGIPRPIRAVLARGLAADPAARWPSMAALCEALVRRGERRRRRVAAWAAGAVALGAVGTFGAAQWSHARAQARCEVEAHAIDGTWNDARATAIGDAFAAAPAGYAPETWARSRPRLDGWAGQWSAARRDVCEASGADGTLEADRADAIRACLDDHHAHLAALLARLATPDAAVVAKTALAVASLPPVPACGDDTTLRRYLDLPPDAAERERIAGLRAQLAESVAAQAMGRYEEALGLAEGVIADADALERVALAAEARLAAADALDRLGRIDEARRYTEQAYFAADGIHRDDVALRASATLVFFDGVLSAEHDQALRWARIAQTHADRAGADPMLVALMELNVGTMHRARGDADEAVTHLLRAHALYEQTAGPDSPSVGSTLNNLANARHDQGDYAEAVTLLERALEIDEATRGPQHPSVASTLNNLGVIEHRRRRYEAALAYHERALAIRKVALGEEHPDVAASLNNIGAAKRGLGDAAGALAVYERAFALRERALGPDHPELAATIDNLGLVHRDQGDLDEARRLHERALQLREQGLGESHPEVAASLIGLGQVHLQLGDPARALAMFTRAHRIWTDAHGPDHPLVATALEYMGDAHEAAGTPADAVARWEEALAIRSARETPPAQLATLRFGIARMLWASDGDRRRARALAAEAAETWGELGDAGADELAKARAWLAEHDAP